MFGLGTPWIAHTSRGSRPFRCEFGPILPFHGLGCVGIVTEDSQLLNLMQEIVSLLSGKGSSLLREKEDD